MHVCEEYLRKEEKQDEEIVNTKLRNDERLASIPMQIVTEASLALNERGWAVPCRTAKWGIYSFVFFAQIFRKTTGLP